MYANYCSSQFHILIFYLIIGVAVRSKKSFSEDPIGHAPFTLLPTPFPKLEFEKAVKIQTSLNMLLHNVAHDYEFLKNALHTYV